MGIVAALSRHLSEPAGRYLWEDAESLRGATCRVEPRSVVLLLANTGMMEATGL
jgi:hypothetical protein